MKENDNKINRIYSIIELILLWNVNRLCFFVNLCQVKEIEQHEGDPGQREEYPGLSVNPQRYLLVFFTVFFLFRISFFLVRFCVRSISYIKVE